MPNCITEGAIRAATQSKNCLYSLVQMMYKVLKDILKVLCFTSEMISTMDWYINVLRSLTLHKLYAHDGHGSRLHFRVRTAATNENPKLSTDIMIRNHRLLRKQILDGHRVRYHHVPDSIPT
jgi:hypothetical protein